ncbi:MAG TPA: hypothetical protein VMB79_05460 [Jatrophihabitans sp.]|nr:hypothetical protein [Jatrophihabitans sp.]
MAAFQSVQYVDPFAPLPVGATQAGVQAALTGGPAGQVAYAQLLANLTPIGYGTGSTNTSVRVLNAAPLAAGLAYLLQVQFAPAGQNPADLDWSNPAAVISSPVVAQQARLVSAQVSGTGLAVTWEPAAGTAIAGAFVQLVDLTTNNLTSGYYLGAAQSAPITATFTAGHSYGLRISAVQPVAGGTMGNFSAPYTIGPPSAVQPVPTTAPGLTRVGCGDTGLVAAWTAAAVPANAGAPRYELLLLDGGQLVSTAPAGSTGGQLATAELAGLTSPQVAARASYGSFTGPAGAGAAVYPLAPQVLGVSVAGTSSVTVTAQLAAAGALPAGGSLLATLYSDGVAGPTQTLSAATGSVTWTGITVSAGVSYEVGVALQVSAGGVQSLGAASARQAVPLIAPSAVSAAYDGQAVVVDLTFATGQPVDGYQVTLTGSGGGQHLVQAGPQLPISFAADLDLGQTWTASVVPVLGIVTARSGGGQLTLPTVTAPSLSTVGYDGSALTLQWTAAELPYLTGYRVAVAGGPTLVLGGDQTSCTVPLTPAQAAAAAVTVTGLSALRETAASTSVPVVASTIEVSSVTVGSQVVASWTATPAPPAVRAVLLLGGAVIGTLTGATATGVSFAPPTPAGQPYTLVAYPVSADGVATGPGSAPVPLILTAPVLESGQLSTGALSLRWQPGSSFGVTGYRLTATPTTGNAASLLVTGTGYDGPAPAAFAAPGTLTVTPVGDRCTGPAASATISAAVAVTGAGYANGQLSVTADLAAAGATDTSWLEVLVNGQLLARQVLTGPAQSPFTVPVALPPGSTATTRLSLVGPGTLAPPATPAAVPTLVPEVIEAAYDGSALHVSWLPTGETGVAGYLVSVAGTAAEPVYMPGADSAAAAITVSLSYPFPAGVAASVRALTAAPTSTPCGQGQPSPGRLPRLAGSRYSAAVSEPGYPPYLYRRGQYQTLASVTGQPIVLYLAKPFSGVDNPTVPASGSPVFQLAPAPAGSTLPYQLTMSAEVWTSLGASPVRSSLRDSYDQFLSDVETAGVTPWGIGLLRQLIAQAMPQTFEEVLYYRYGYWRSDSLRVVDLTPGTRLQLSNALYQAVVGGASEKNGFLALGNETLDIVDAIPQGGAGTLPAGAGRILSVDALLSLIYPGSGSAPAGSPVAAGPLDFFADGNRQSYYRLFFPVSFPASGSTGSTALTSNITLVGTTSWATLTSITAQYAATGTFPTGVSYFASYFRGRSGLTPLINVSVQGESRWTALGTSVRQALTSVGLAPYWAGSGGTELSLLRASANLFGYPTPDGGLALEPVDLTGADLNGLTPLYWPLDMPLVGGDQLGLRPSSPAVP